VKALLLTGLFAFTAPALAAGASDAPQTSPAPGGNVIWDSNAIPYNAQTRDRPYLDPSDVIRGTSIKGNAPTGYCVFLKAPCPPAAAPVKTEKALGIG
jgi:hypothetical protein